MSATAVAVRKPFPGSYRKTAVLVGVLFLSATATFAVGSALITSYFAEASGRASTLLAGVLFQGIGALAGAGIGIAMLPVLRHYNPGLARGYAGLRIGEGLMMISAGVYMVATKQEFFHYDAFIYLFTVSAGLIFSYVLYMSGWIPRFLAQLGLVGYTVLAIGIPVTLMSAVQLDAGWGLIFVLPGAAFEFVVPLLLIFKGFSFDRQESRPDDDRVSGPLEPIAVPA
jgi:MFS family permease